LWIKVTEQNPLITLWIKAFNENKRALSPFKNEANNKLDVDTFKDLVLEYSLSLSLMALIIKFMLLLSSETPSIFLNLFINHWVGLTGNFELLSIEYSKTKSLNVSTSNLLLASFLKGDNALLFSLKDKSIIAFNKSLSLEVKNNEFSENTFEVIFDTAKVQALKPRLQKTYKKSIRKGFDETFNNDVEVIR
jgi:hypothetical protein